MTDIPPPSPLPVLLCCLPLPALFPTPESLPLLLFPCACPSGVSHPCLQAAPPYSCPSPRRVPSLVGNEPLIAASRGADYSRLVSVTPSSQICHGHLSDNKSFPKQPLAGVMDLMWTAPQRCQGTRSRKHKSPPPSDPGFWT